MIALNLIPREQKTLLKNTRLYAVCKEAVTLLFLFFTIISIMLWVSRFYLEQDLADLVIANSANIKSNEATNQRIIAINQKINSVDNIEKNFISAREAIETISRIVPENITLNSINFYRQQSAVELTGTAKARNDLLQFRNILGSADWIKSVDLPMDNLINKDNNQFTIKLNVDISKLNSL